jgi:hypothetical protein
VCSPTVVDQLPDQSVSMITVSPSCDSSDSSAEVAPVSRPLRG